MSKKGVRFLGGVVTSSCEGPDMGLMQEHQVPSAQQAVVFRQPSSIWRYLYVKLCHFYKGHQNAFFVQKSWARWLTPVIAVLSEAEARESP